jgi:hypothetical protein
MRVKAPPDAAGNQGYKHRLECNGRFLKDVVALLERTARNGARTHCNHVFRIGHLIVKTHDLWRHFFGHSACDNHQVGLTRRWPKNFSAETRDVIARRRGRDHLNRATSESELSGQIEFLRPQL